ncbi:MAG TPA: HD domain-containing protein [Vicinamibacterales bacterium]|nr:HD domain-containing protein [Vicinamibacterales bacterium]
MAEAPKAPPMLVAVLDMGASAIRLVVAEVSADKPTKVLQEASRGVLLGRDVFSTGAIRPQTVDAVITALEGFRNIMDEYGVEYVRAVATSAMREARNAETVLDRIRSRTRIVFEIINEAEESRLMYLAVRHALGKHGAFKSERALLVEVGGGSTSVMILRRGKPQRSGVYGLGSIRMRQQLDLRRHSQAVQTVLLKRLIANVITEIRVDIPLKRVTQVIAIGGDIRFAAAQLGDKEINADTREVTRDAFLAFCDQVEGLDDEALVEKFRLPVIETETLLPALLVYRAFLTETVARKMVVADVTLRAGILLEFRATAGKAKAEAEDFEDQVLASAESVGVKYRFDRAHGRHVLKLALQLFDQLRDEHGLLDSDRLLLQVAALLHDIGVYVSLRRHHKHSQYLLASSQIFGLTDEQTALVGNIARYHRRGMPQRSHLEFMQLDPRDRLRVQKLAAILRVANALDAEHLQKVRQATLIRQDRNWSLEIEGIGDLTMELMAAAARADMFREVFGRELAVRSAGIPR